MNNPEFFIGFFIGGAIGIALVTIITVVLTRTVHPVNVMALATAIVLLAVGTWVHS